MYFGNIVILKKFLAIIEIKFCKSLNLLELPRTLAINGPDLTGHIPLQLQHLRMMFAIHTRLVLVMNDNITCRLSSRSFSPFNGRIHQKGFWFSCFNFLKRIIFNECDEGRMVCFRKYKSYQSSHLMIVHRLLIHYPFHRFNNIIRQYFVSQQ